MTSTETCTYCEGSGEAEKWKTATLPGGETIRAEDCMDDVKQLISEGAFPGVVVHWEEADCPKCAGRGSYEVEHFQGVRVF